MSIRNRETKIYLDYEIPKEQVISEGDKLLKDLLSKQLNKDINLQNELSRRTQFETPTELLNETEYLSGQNNLKEFKTRAKFLQDIQELKSAGLDDDEIQFYLDYKKGENYLKSKHKNLSSIVLKARYNNILKKICDKSRNINEERHSNLVSRHVQEIAINTKPNSLETKLYKFAASCSAQNEINTLLNHPINTLPELEEKLFGRLQNPKVPSLKKRRKKAKKFLDSEDTEITPKNELKNNPQSSKWDVKNSPKNETKSEEYTKKSKIYTCSTNKKYTIKNNEIVEITKNHDKAFERSIKGKPFVGLGVQNNSQNYEKLTEEDIRKLPKFLNYEKGTPSKILYIKNIAKQTTENDLVDLFSCFDDADKTITYRLLTGKMAGQAFITFNSTDQATDAMEKVNGIIVKNKPLVIQYSRKP